MMGSVPLELVTAAMSAAVRPRAAVSIFAPFDAFKWTGGGKIRAPTGRTTAEAKDVAWLMTCAPRLEARVLREAADSLAYATHLRREVPVVEALYANLSARADQLVHVREIESMLGCAWGEVTVDLGGGEMQRVDPHFWKLFENAVRDSVHAYVDSLDSALLKLKGCEAGQAAQATENAMGGVRRATAHRLANALLDRTTTAATMVELLVSMRNGWLPQHVAAAKARMRDSIRRVLALARVVASADDKLEEALQVEESELRALFADLPPELRDELQQRKISILEIGTVFAPNHNGLVQHCANVPPPSFAVRASVLARWMARCSDSVSEACVSVIAMMRRAADLPPLSPEWASVQLSPASRGGPLHSERAVEWLPPTHLDAQGSGSETRTLTADATHHYTGLRVARLFAVLLQQARLGLLPAVTIKASLLVPIVARVASEGQSNYGQHVEARLRPVAMRCEHAWPEDRGHLGKRRAPPASLHSTALAAPAEEQRPPQQPRLAAEPTAASRGSVPPELLRDHGILHGIALCLQSHMRASSMRISLNDVLASVRSVAPMFQSHGDASLRQAVRWVCCEVIKRANAQVAEEGGSGLTMEFSSDRDRLASGHVGGIVCQGDGIAYLFKYVTWCVNQMRFNGAAFCSVWHVSRSAQSKAVAMGRKIMSAKGAASDKQGV
jgi:hypothetical protein